MRTRSTTPPPRAPPFQEAERAIDVRRVQRLPAARGADDGALRGRELEQLLLAELDVADGEAPVEGGDGVGLSSPLDGA